MRVFVTGSAGFIGFHLVQRLLRDGHTVAGFDGMTKYYDVTLKESRSAILRRSKNFTEVRGLLEDKTALAAAVSALSPDVIVHLAAQAGVRYGLENPRAYFDSNLTGSFNLFEAARIVRPRHLVIASTSSVYGSNDSIPFRETDRTGQPLSLYAATKIGMEAMAHSYAHLHGMPTTALRFFTVYGPWGRPDMALFKFTSAILAGEPVEVYGDGRMTRDFTFIDDLIEAIMRVISLPPQDEKAPYRTINIGGGQPVVLSDFIAAIELALGKTALRKFLPHQPGDMRRTFASADELVRLTGFRPSTPLSVGVPAFVDWYKEYFGLPIHGDENVSIR